MIIVANGLWKVGSCYLFGGVEMGAPLTKPMVRSDRAYLPAASLILPGPHQAKAMPLSRSKDRCNNTGNSK